MSMWESFPDDARVWIYASPEKLSSEIQERMLRSSQSFLAQWQAHGQSLNADVQIFHDHFLVFFVDESSANATGCSIDASVRFVKELELSLGLDMLDRSKVYVKTPEGVQHFDFRNVPTDLPADAHVFNHSVSDLGAFRKEWELPLAESWLTRG